MSVFLNDVNVIEKILAVEFECGPSDWGRLDYRDSCLLNPNMNNSFLLFKNAWDALPESERQTEKFMHVGNNDSIYGKGGWSRYYV